MASWKIEGAAESYEGAQGGYVEALGDLGMGVFDAGVPGAYNSRFGQMAGEAEGDTQQKMRR